MLQQLELDLGCRRTGRAFQLEYYHEAVQPAYTHRGARLQLRGPSVQLSFFFLSSEKEFDLQASALLPGLLEICAPSFCLPQLPNIQAAPTICQALPEFLR